VPTLQPLLQLRARRTGGLGGDVSVDPRPHQLGHLVGELRRQLQLGHGRTPSPPTPGRPTRSWGDFSAFYHPVYPSCGRVRRRPDAPSPRTPPRGWRVFRAARAPASRGRGGGGGSSWSAPSGFLFGGGGTATPPASSRAARALYFAWRVTPKGSR